MGANPQIPVGFDGADLDLAVMPSSRSDKLGCYGAAGFAYGALGNLPAAALAPMGLPPEVHAVALRTGPGAGPTKAAAAAWRMLSAKHASAAIELSTALSSVQPQAWRGPGAES